MLIILKILLILLLFGIKALLSSKTIFCLRFILVFLFMFIILILKEAN
ncbi:hypothetical protein SMULJ23_0269 [Streptococcus mutans LJ23]|nr:hypothetical protein SmuNN2025_0243 [Streptococcus mutans NN2025]BAL68603.1 hypothetical protein SMULJ23_0269 [Streptococcus mutans LJ23]